MERVKKVKTRRVFDDDFKAEIVKMRSAAKLNSGKNVPELSKSFDIAENIFANARYHWKTNQNMKKQTKTSEQQSTYLLQTIAENEKFRKDVSRLKDERDILKKVLAGVPVTLFSKSD